MTCIADLPGLRLFILKPNTRVLEAGVFEGVVVMWMIFEMMKIKSIFHRVTKIKKQASEYIDCILSIDGLIVEVVGHIVVNGKCIQRCIQIFCSANWLGLLTESYNINKLAAVT